jgi:hypothetical protein
VYEVELLTLQSPFLVLGIAERANDQAQGCAELMADIGKEDRLGPIELG